MQENVIRLVIGPYEDFDIVSDAAQKVTNVAIAVVFNEVADSYANGFVSLAFPWSRTVGISQRHFW